MSDADESQLDSGEIRETAWNEKRLQRDAVYYADLKSKYEEFIKGNEILTIPEVLNAVNTRKIPADHRCE